MRDKVFIGAIVGLLSDAIKLIFNYITFRLNLVNIVFWQITATRFLKKSELFKPTAYLIGAVIDLTMATAIGVIFIYFLHYTSRNHIWLKGIVGALLVWVGFLGALINQSEAKLNFNSIDVIVTLIGHFVFGLSLAFFAKKLYKHQTEPI